MRVHPIMAFRNESSVLADTDVALFAHAIGVQCAWHFQPNWGSSASCMFYPKAMPVPADAWQLVFLDDSDQAGALGYHDWQTETGMPIGKVFAKTDRDYGYLPSVTASHEVLEMLADPDISRVYQTENARFHALEVGDPVEADADGYDIEVGGAKVRVSNFILPSWFGQSPGSPDKRFDRGGLLTAPLSLRHGGYESYWTPVAGWQQKNAQGKLRPLSEDDSPRWRDRSKTWGTP